MKIKINKTIGLAVAGLLCSATAVALPWDIDLVDAFFIRGYEAPMTHPPEHSVSVNNYRPTGFEHLPVEEVEADYVKTGYAMSIYNGQSDLEIVDPFAGKEDAAGTLSLGEVAFVNYCQTCHGYKGTGKTKAQEQWPLQKTGRFEGIPNLHGSNKAGVVVAGSGSLKSVNEVYLIIRNGRDKMPGYGHAMSEDEIWSAIHYLRSLPGNKL